MLSRLHFVVLASLVGPPAVKASTLKDILAGSWHGALQCTRSCELCSERCETMIGSFNRRAYLFLVNLTVFNLSGWSWLSFSSRLSWVVETTQVNKSLQDDRGNWVYSLLICFLLSLSCWKQRICLDF